MVKTRDQVKAIRKACGVCSRILARMGKMVAPGMTTAELEHAGRILLAEEGVRSAFLGYQGYPAAFCISVNDEVVHGIPAKTRVLAEGDVVSIDVGVVCDGYFGDCAATFPVGKVSDQRRRLLEITRQALADGIAQAVAGNRVGDVASAIQSRAEDAGYSVVRQFAGHGVGCALHEPPEIPNFGTPGTGEVLRENMTIAIEPMVNEGTWKVRILDDGWTVVTVDGTCSAHFEDTVLVRRGAPEILTRVEHE